MTTVDTVGVPRLALFHRTEEHLVEAQSVGTELLHNHVGIHHVEHRLRHLLHSPATHILAFIVQDELSGVILWAPSLESLHIQHIGTHNVHVHMDGRHIILVLLLQSHKRVRVLDAIDKVAPALNHALVNQFLERLFLARHTHVEEELVPEAAVNQVTRSMFATAHIQIDILPILVSLLAHQSLVVVWVHIAQIVGRTARKAWHGVEFDGEHRLIVNLRVLHNLPVHLVPSPHRSIAQWRFTCLRRQELVHLRQLDRQTLLGNHRRDAILVIYRERLTPITLT